MLALAGSGPQPGDPVRIDAGAVVLEGTLAAHDASGWTLRMSNGDVFVPADLARSVTVRAGAVVLPPVPVKPVLVPPTTRTRGPRLGTPGGAWITRFPALVSVSLAGAPVTRDTAFRARTNAIAAGGGASAEIGVRFLSIGAAAGFERAATQLVPSGASGCRRDEPGRCFDFPRGLMHETQTFHGSLWLKPNLVLGPVRPWALGGVESARIEYAYHDGGNRFAGGSTTASAPVLGAGIDWATPGRGWVFSAGVLAGGPLFEEDVEGLLGRPWKSEASPVRPPVRATIGISLPIGGRS